MPAPVASHQLYELAELLHHLEPEGPCAVGVDAHDGHLELALRALDPDEPALALIGASAPDRWDAFGLRLAGQAGSVVHVVDRLGRQVSNGRGEPPPAAWPSDVCRRVLGLPTRPPESTTADLLASWWLDAILGLILGTDLGQPPPDWPACRALLAGLGEGSLASVGALVSAHFSWTDVHRWARTRPLCGMSCDTAEWFDVGSYSRFVLGLYGPLGELRTDIGELVAPVTADALTEVLDQWPLHGDQ